MGKLVYHFGAMNAGKSALLLQMAYQLQGKKSFGVYTAKKHSSIVESRLGISRKCKHIDALFQDLQLTQMEYIFIDECQWLKGHHIRKLRHLADRTGIKIHCFGLRSDVTGQMYSAARILFILADEVEHMKSFCVHCNNSAILHNRVEGKTGKEAYESVCYEHFKGE